MVGGADAGEAGADDQDVDVLVRRAAGRLASRVDGTVAPPLLSAIRHDVENFDVLSRVGTRLYDRRREPAGGLDSERPRPPARGARAARASGDERERAILAHRRARCSVNAPLSEISVDDLARGAGISRPTFYFYFASKEAVLLTLVDRLVEEGRGARDEALALRARPRGRLREGRRPPIDDFGSHRAVILAAVEPRATSAEVRELWARVMEGWVAARDRGDRGRARARRRAPRASPRATSRSRSLQMNERALHASFAGEARPWPRRRSSTCSSTSGCARSTAPRPRPSRTGRRRRSGRSRLEHAEGDPGALQPVPAGRRPSPRRW